MVSIKFNVKKLKKIRLSRGLDCESMARLIGVATTTYKRKENGDSEFSVNEVSLMFQYLGLDYDLFGAFFDVRLPVEHCVRAVAINKEKQAKGRKSI